MENLTRRNFIEKTTIIGLGALLSPVLGGCKMQPGNTAQASETISSENNSEFMVGSINFGTEGAKMGPPTKLVIDVSGEAWQIPQFIIPTYPRKLNSEDIEPAGNWRENDNPTYLNYGGIIVQTVHSGYLWNGTQLAADPVRAEIQEIGNILGRRNVTYEEGLQRREKFMNAPFKLEQNGNIEEGIVLGIFHINPQSAQELNQEYIKSEGGPVNMVEFSDYNGPDLNPETDVIYFFCSEPYSNETPIEGIDHISQGREILIIRINK